MALVIVPTDRNSSAQCSSVLTINLKFLDFGRQPETYCMPSLLLTSAVTVAPCRKAFCFPLASILVFQEDEKYNFKTYVLLHVFSLYF